MRWLWTVAVIVGSCLGCSSSVEQPDGTTVQFRWLAGELKTAVARSLPATEEATRAAFEELRLVGVDTRSDRLVSRLRALMSDGTRVRVKLEAAGTDHTFVHIKVGTIGDKAVSLQILRHVDRNLAKNHPSEKK
jgi:hypothetical protein